MAKRNNFSLDTAVIAAAGYGARLLPLTLHQPKAMIAIADRPLIHYIIDQIARGGIRNFLIVINPKFQAIRKYLDYQKQKNEWRDLRFKIIEKKSASFADSVLAAKRYIKNGYFIAAACDDLIDDKVPPFLSLKKTFQRHKKPVVVIRKISRSQVSNYGVISGRSINKDLWAIKNVVEKPSPQKAPSLFGAIGDYVLPADIFRFIQLAKKNQNEGREVSVIDALKLYLADGGSLLGWVYKGRHFDGGSKLGLLKALIYFGTKHAEMGRPFKKYLQSL